MVKYLDYPVRTVSQNGFDLAGKDLREWSFIILMFTLSIAIMAWVVSFVIAIMNTPENITITGSIDLSQITGIIIGIAMVAVVLVSQQLTSKQQANAVAATDNVWIGEEKKP